MLLRLLILSLFGVGSLLAAEPAKENGAGAPVVVIAGHITDLQQTTADGKVMTTVSLAVDANSSVTASTPQDVTAITQAFKQAAEKRMTALTKRLEPNNQRLKANTDLFIDALTSKDTKKAEALGKENEALLKENAAITKEIAALGRPLGMTAVIEGTLEFKDKNWRVVGTVRPWDPEGKDRTLGPGRAQVRGEAVPGEYKVGKGTSPLALRTGGLLIVVTGKAIKDDAKVEGLVLAGGRLELTKEGAAVLTADQLEVVKK